MLGFFNVENCVIKGCGEFFYRYHEERSLSCLFQHVALCTLSLERARSYLCSVNCCCFLTSLRVERYRGRWGLSGCVLPQQGAQNRREPLWASYQYYDSTLPRCPSFVVWLINWQHMCAAMTIVLFSVTKRRDTFLSEFFDLGAAILQAARRVNLALFGFSRFFKLCDETENLGQTTPGPKAPSELDVRTFARSHVRAFAFSQVKVDLSRNLSLRER